MMTISNVTSSHDPTLNPYLSNAQSAWKQRAEDFKALAGALQSGDLAGAQQAFAAWQKDQPNSAQPASAGGASSPTTQAGRDLQALQSALSSGDLTGAQKAFATLKQDMHGAGRAGHHHHHRGGSVNSTTQAGSSTSDTTATQLLGGTLNVQA